MGELKNEEEERAQDQIRLKLVNAQNTEIGTQLITKEFNVKASTKFQKVAKAYAERQNVDVKSLRFLLHDGTPIQRDQDVTVAAVFSN